LAIRNLEDSLRHNRPRALIQMATGSGKTLTACTFCYRLMKFAKAKRMLFLVDRNHLGRQAMSEFQQYVRLVSTEVVYEVPVMTTIRTRPMSAFLVSLSLNAKYATATVTMMLSLSIGTTRLVGPSCNAL
jgi:Rad3-related DNA helicase